jgi:hypothetical protein
VERVLASSLDFTKRVFDTMMDRSLPIPCAKEWRVWVEKIDRLVENYRAYLSEQPEGLRTILEALQRDRKWATEMWENRKEKEMEESESPGGGVSPNPKIIYAARA